MPDPRTPSHVPERTFVPADAATAIEAIYACRYGHRIRAESRLKYDCPTCGQPMRPVTGEGLIGQAGAIGSSTIRDQVGGRADEMRWEAAERFAAATPFVPADAAPLGTEASMNDFPPEPPAVAVVDVTTDDTTAWFRVDLLRHGHRWQSLYVVGREHAPKAEAEATARAVAAFLAGG